MLWLQSSISTVAQELWYSPWTTIRSSWVTWILRGEGTWGLRDSVTWGLGDSGTNDLRLSTDDLSLATADSLASRASRCTAFSSVLAGSRLSVSPNSYGFGAPVVSTPVACSRVSWRP